MFSIKEMFAAKRTWIQYFVSLFVIFLILLLILGAFLYWNVVHKLREEVEAFNC